MFDIRQSKRRQATGVYRMICLLFLATILCPPCQADVVWVRGEDQPRYGWVVSQNDQKVVFRPVGEMESRQEDLDRSVIETLIVNFDRLRLENLNPENFADYRDYAEELAAQKMDPVARNLAVRLYIIAAAGSSDEVRQSSLRGLVALAENDQQHQKWDTLRRLHETTGRISQQTTRTLSDAIKPEERQQTLQIVRMIRRGKGIEAAELLAQPNASKAFRHWAHVCSVEELTRISLLNRPTYSQLHQLLRIELSILNNESKTRISEESQGRSWGEYAQATSTITGVIPSFRTATRFDPQKSIYRGGRWINPE